MIVQSAKLRHVTIGMQLMAGFGLLTASYFTTDKGWANDLLEAAVYSTQPAMKSTLSPIKVNLSC